MITREAIVAEAREWMGTRWQHQASLKGVATDCIGFVGGVALALGIPGAAEWKADPSLHCYGRTPDTEMLYGACERFMDRIPVAEADVGDVWVMDFSKAPGLPHHFAIITRTDPRYLIHAYPLAKRVVENGADVAGARALRAYRFRGLAWDS